LEIGGEFLGIFWDSLRDYGYSWQEWLAFLDGADRCRGSDARRHCDY